MRSSSFRCALVAALAAATAVGPSGASAGSRPEPDHGCFWSSAINVKTANIAFPNGAITNYWYDKFTLPAGARVILRGRYPHARYMSLTSYYSDASRTGVASDGIHDAEIRPDPGSRNPFRPGALRAGDGRRSWTLTVSGAQPPADPGERRRNTLYAGTLPGDQSQPIELGYRVYAPDRGYDVAGGGGLPRAKLVLADGTKLTGRAACGAVSVDTAPPPTPAMGLNAYLSLTHLPPNPGAAASGSPPEAPAVNPAKWYRPINQCHFTDPFFQAAGYPLQPCSDAPAVTQYPTKDNAYITAYVDRSLGPAPNGHNVLVVTGKMPSTVPTYHGRRTFARHAQLRYWGICTNESLVTTRATVSEGCAYDEQIPLGARRKYTIVISTRQDRPANARTRCGFKWLNWGEGDRAPAPHARATAGLLIVRNLIPDKSFRQAAQKIPAPGLPDDVAATMGPYLPRLKYQSTARFAARGCHAQAALS
jgi:hypothetical protein